MESPKLPLKTLGSLPVSKTNSPGSSATSMILPFCTTSMPWPSLTAMTESFEMTLSSPRVLELRPPVRLLPLQAKTSAGIDSQ